MSSENDGPVSGRDSQLLKLTARLLTAKLRGQTAAGHGGQGLDVSGRRSPL